MAFNSKNYLEVNNQASVASPSGAQVRFYSKVDGKAYAINQAGVEYDLTATGDLTNVTTNIIPASGSTYDIGTAAKPFASGYFDALIVNGQPISGSQVSANTDNIMLNAFRIAMQGDLSVLNMIDGFVDEYEDQSGIDASGSVGESYNFKDAYYTNIDTETKLLLHFSGSEDQISNMFAGNTDYQMSASNFIYGAKASSNKPSDTVAWHGFSGNKTSTPVWDSAAWESSPYLQYEFYEPKVIKSYGVANYDAASTLEAPASWVFQGSNNGEDWRDLHTVHGETFDPKSSTQTEAAIDMSVTKYYNMDNNAAYKFYRIKIENRFGALGAPAGASPDTVPTGTPVYIQELQMFDTHTFFAEDSSGSNHGLYPVRDAISLGPKTFGQTDVHKANAALYYDNTSGRTFIKRLTPHQESIRIVPELRAGNNANTDTVGGNPVVYGGSNYRPGGRVSASLWHGSYEPWKAFQRQNTVATDGWYCNDTAGWPAWLMWESFGEPSTCTHYSLAASAVTIDGTPRTWKLSGNSGNEIPELGQVYNMTPVMTSNVLPFPYEASASSELSGTYYAYTAFNNVKTGANGWITPIMATPSGWLQMKLDQPRVLNRYSVTSPTGGEADRAPSAWTFLGSNAPSASGWDVLDTQTGHTNWDDNEEREFFLTPGAPYQYYRIDCTANNGDSQYLSIQELELGHTEVQANDDDGTAQEVWYMFDRVTNGTIGWQTQQTSGGWTTMVLPNEKTIRGYDVTANSSATYLLANPNSWKLYGNNSDTAIATKLLCNFDGSDGATSYTSDDLFGRVATFAANAQLDTAQKKFGSASLLLDGTGDYVSFDTIGPNRDFTFGNYPFTIDAWVRYSNVAGGGTYQSIISNYTDANNRWSFVWDETNTQLLFVALNNGTTTISVASDAASWSPVINTWYHVAVIRGWNNDNETIAFTVDGSVVGTVKTSQTGWSSPNLEAITYVGSYDGTLYYHFGWIDALRVTKGTALWTADFSGSLPTSAYTPVWNELDEQVDQEGWRVNERRSYEVTSPSGCKAYKWGDITNDGHGTYTMIQEFEMFETPWTELDSQHNTSKWITEETRLYPISGALQAEYESYRLDISDPYNPGNIMNLGELTLFNADPSGTAYSATSDFEIGWGDFTMEGWFLWNGDVAGETTALFETGYQGNNEGVMAYWDNGNRIYAYSNGTNQFNRYWAYTPGRWHHIVYQRENGAFQLFADGKQLGEDYEWHGYIRSHYYDPKLGAYSDLSAPFTGYQKELRYSNVARYPIGVEASGTRNFTPQTEPFVRDDDTKLLVHGNQYNEDFQDYCAHFNDDYDFIGIPYHEDLVFEKKDFTIETHIKVLQTGTQYFYSQGGLAATDGSLRCSISHNSQLVVELDAGSYAFNFNFYQGAWYHVAIVRTNNRLRAYVNGAEVGSDAQKGVDISNQSLDSTDVIRGDFARLGNTFNDNYGWMLMRNFRISNIARYTDNFFSPKEEYTSDENTVILLPLKDTEGLIPTFGGYWQPEDTHCHASTEQSNTYRAWKAFNGVDRLDASCWRTDGTNDTGWLEWELANAVTASGYVVGGYSGTTEQAQDWTLQGTNTRPYNVVSLQNYHGCCIPRMQANICPGNASAEWPDTMVHYKYECSASSQNNNTSEAAFNAFEYVGNAEWRTENLVPFNQVDGAWLMFDFTEDDKRIITQYGFRCGVVAATPTSWIFQASNDGETWVDLDDHQNLEDRVDYPSVWVVNDRKYWAVDNDTAYRYYRLYVREVSTLTTTYVAIRDFFMYDGSRATASHTHGIDVEAYKAFNGTTQSLYGWRGSTAAGGTAWLQYDFAPGSPKTIVRYDITNAYTDGANISPQDWTFEGSNTDMKDYAPILNQFDTIALGRYRGDARATASSTFSDWWPYNAFNHQYDLDGGTGGGWSANATTGWLRIELDDPFIVKAYTIVAQLGTLTTLPKDWTFEGATEADALTTMLLHLDGADTSTTFTDTSLNVNVLTAVGSAQLDTAQFKFGTASLLLNGSTDYATIPVAGNYFWEDDLNFEGEDFCFEGWFRFNTTPDDFALWGSSLVGCHFDIFDANSIRIYDSWTPSDFIEFTTSTLSTGTWYHIAIARDGNDMRVFLDGVQQDETKDCGGHAYNHNRSGLHQLGAYNSLHFYDGWMDEIRISKGTSRYTSNFTVESSAWTDPSWDVLDTVTGETSWIMHERRKFNCTNSTAYKNYRLNVTANDGGASYVRLQELELHKEQDSWTTLDTVTGETTWTNGERKTFEFSNSTPYTSYRLDITANNGATSVAVQELALFEEQNWTTLDTVTGETGWIAWENRYFTISNPGSYKYYKWDVTQNNGAVRVATSHLQLVPATHLAKDYGPNALNCWVSGEVDCRLHEHWLTNIVQDDSRADEDYTHMMYHVGAARSGRTNITGTGSLYTYGGGDRIEIMYHNDFNMYAREDDSKFASSWGWIIAPNTYQTDVDFTVTWWSNWQANQNSTWVALFRYQEGMMNHFVSDRWRCTYDNQEFNYLWRPALHAWQHYACVRKGNTLYMFIDGKLVMTGDCTRLNMKDVLNTYQVIIAWDNQGSYYHIGQMDEVQIIKGFAKWTSDFTPPVVPTSIVNDMTLKSTAIEAESQPDNARITVFGEPVDSITLNTDLIAYVSRDNGETWSVVTLADQGEYESDKSIYAGTATISGQPSGTNMKYKFDVANGQLKIHGTGMSWS